MMPTWKLLVALLILLASAPAGAAVFKVGPSSWATHRDLQSAVDAALAAGGVNDVRVQAVTLDANLVVDSAMKSGRLTISGGWNSTFTLQLRNGFTTLDGRGARVLLLQPMAGQIILSRLVITGGLADKGGGIRADLGSGAALAISSCSIVDNVATRTGGGIYLLLDGSGDASVRDSSIARNRVDGELDRAASGGGVTVEADGSSTFSLVSLTIEDNEAAANGNQSTGGGIYLDLDENTVGELLDSRIEGNLLAGIDAVGIASGGALWASDTATLTARRNLWIDNRDEQGGAAAQLSLSTSVTGELVFTDSVVTLGSHGGIGAVARDTGVLRLINLTVLDHRSSTGISAGARVGATASVYNSIAYGNLRDFEASSADTGSNLGGVDPMLVDPAGRDWSPAPGSPAIDMGDNDPPGGLGPLDFYGDPRVHGSAVDIGAAEFVPEPALALLQLSALAVMGLLARPRAEPAR